MHKKSAFTLVELIVVITILAILGTIAFLSFQWYSSSARDSVRTEDIVNISKGLELLSIERWTLPIPVNGVALTSWATTVTQGTINNSILPRLSSNVKDVLTGKEYRYSILGNGQYYQVLAELENPLSRNISPIGIDTAYAASTVTPSLRWNYTFDPSLPSLFVSSGSTLFDPNNCFVLDKGTNTLSNPVGCTPKKSLSLKDYDSWLVWYWDMETLTGTKLADLSGNGNDGTFSGGLDYSSSVINGKIWQGLNLSNSGHLVEVPDSVTGSILDLTGDFTQEITIYYSWKSSTGGPIFFSKWIVPNYNYKLALYLPTSVDKFEFTTWIWGIQTQAISKTIPWIWNWYHVVGTYQVISGEMRIYVNWNYSWNTKKIGVLPNNNDSIIFWKYIASNTYSLFGIIDDAKLYNTALSDKQISQHARASGF